MSKSYRIRIQSFTTFVLFSGVHRKESTEWAIEFVYNFLKNFIDLRNIKDTWIYTKMYSRNMFYKECSSSLVPFEFQLQKQHFISTKF